MIIQRLTDISQALAWNHSLLVINLECLVFFHSPRELRRRNASALQAPFFTSALYVHLRTTCISEFKIVCSKGFRL